MDDKTRMLIYINGMASLYLQSEKLRDYITNQLNTEEWVDCSMTDFPIGLVDEEMEPSFYHGVATEQLKHLKTGGVFVNPLMSGLAVDFGVWADAIKEISHFGQTIKYLDIPYEVYMDSKLGNIVDTFKVDEDNYKQSHEAAQRLVNALIETEQGELH